MYTIKMKIYEELVVEIMVICDFNHHNSDFFLSNKKTTLGPRQLGPVCSDLLHKNNFASFSFFWPPKHFSIKNAKRFAAYFPRKRVTLLTRTLRIRSDRFLNLDFTRKRNIFVKNDINIF